MLSESSAIPMYFSRSITQSKGFQPLSFQVPAVLDIPPYMTVLDLFLLDKFWVIFPKFTVLDVLIRAGAKFSPLFFHCAALHSHFRIHQIFVPELSTLIRSHRELLEFLYKGICFDLQFTPNFFTHCNSFKTLQILLNAGTSSSHFL